MTTTPKVDNECDVVIRFGDDQKRTRISGSARRLTAIRENYLKLRPDPNNSQNDVEEFKNPAVFEEFLVQCFKDSFDPPMLSAQEKIYAHNLVYGLEKQAPQQTTAVDPKEWRSQFATVDELEAGEVRMIIKNFLPEGTIFFGALAGKGKTLVCLSITKALTTGRPFVGFFDVPEATPVLYLIPESSGKAFRNRLKKFGIPNDPNLFLCRTISQGPTF